MKTMIVLLTTMLTIACSVAFAAIPPMISYQGKLTKADGTPLPDGAYAMRFAIYDDPASAEYLWMERNTTVQVKKGLFSVLLGSVNNLPANIFDAPNRFFGVKVGEDTEMTPRQQISATAFAFRAAIASTVDDGAITPAKLAPGVGTPAGTVAMFAGATAPEGWLLCDGSAISRTQYPAIFAAIGTTYGTGDGTTTFNLPDLQGKVPVGLSTEPEFNFLGKTDGEKTHPLTVEEMPSHSHSGAIDNGFPGDKYAANWQANRDPLYYIPTASTGGNKPHNNLQPYLVMNYMIKQ